MKIKKANILVVEDEKEIQKFLTTTLESNDFNVKIAGKGSEALALLNSSTPDIIILDLGLPDIDGLDIIKKIREWSETPIIILSARGMEEDKVTALENGADDYLTKPFGVQELLARIKVALRHSKKSKSDNDSVFVAGDLKVDFEARTVLVKNQNIHLTPTEYKLLSYLISNQGKVVTHGQLLKEVWGKRSSENSHYLRIYMQHIRDKIGDTPLNPKYIITETGVGYRFKD